MNEGRDSKFENRVRNYLTEVGIEWVKLESRVHNHLTAAGMQWVK